MTSQHESSGSSRWIWPFELLDQIGEGGMGQVYRARYVPRKIEVALKMLPADVSDATALARFEREMEVLKTLRHPNIVRCFGGVCEDKQRFYAMELVPGGSLDDILKAKKRLPWELVIEYALQMCAALECSHDKGVVHRDVKPGNFLVGKDGQLKLSDFGLASVAAARRITAAGKTAGTFLYMAPEQIRGEAVTPQTDLYALGCVLFELLTGRPPFVGATAAATLHMHCKQEPPRITETALECPATLESLVMRLLAKKAADRPASAGAVAEELRNVSQTVMVVDTPRKRSGSSRQISNRPVTLEKEEDSDGTVESIPTPPARGGSLWLTVAAFATAAVMLLFATSLLDDRSRADHFEAAWLEALESNELSVQKQAIRALGDAGGLSEPGMQALVESLDDANPDIREAAVTALGRSGAAARTHSARLLKVQKSDPIPEVRLAAEEALAQVKSAPADGLSAFSVVLGLLLAGGIGGGVYLYMQRRPASAKSPSSRAVQLSR